MLLAFLDGEEAPPVGALQSQPRLAQTLARLAEALNPGGVLLVRDGGLVGRLEILRGLAVMLLVMVLSLAG